MTTPDPRVPSGGQAGFSMVELLVAAGVMALAILGILALFDLNRDLARTQVQVADLQQSVRVAQNEMIRDVRMAGRGGLPRGVLPQGIAVSVRNDVPATGGGHHIAVGDTDSPEVVAGSDVLTVRGVFSTSIYQVNPTSGQLTLDNVNAPTQGTLRLQNPNPNTGIPQDLTPLIDAVKEDTSEALLLVSPLGTFAVVKIKTTGSDVTSNANDIVVAFDIGTVGGTDLEDRYVTLSNGFPPSLRAVAHAGILEEYRYYVREDYTVPNVTTSDLAPKLSRARFRPGTEVAHPADTGLSEDVAENVFDLQIALGVDTDANETISEDGTENDDWLFNAAADVDSNGLPKVTTKWNGAGGALPPLYYVRLTTLARTDRRDRNYQAPLLTTVEDKDYSASPFNVFNSREERMFRRRLLTTVVDLRNVS